MAAAQIKLTAEGEGGAPPTSPHGHRPYRGRHTSNRVLKRRGCADDGCTRSDLDDIWPCCYCNLIWHATCACEFDDDEAVVRPRFWECPMCEVTAASGGETDSSDDEGGDDSGGDVPD